MSNLVYPPYLSGNVVLLSITTHKPRHTKNQASQRQPYWCVCVCVCVCVCIRVYTKVHEYNIALCIPFVQYRCQLKACVLKHGKEFLLMKLHNRAWYNLCYKMALGLQCIQGGYSCLPVHIIHIQQREKEIYIYI